MHNSEFVTFFKSELFIPELKSDTKEKVLKELIQPLIRHNCIKSKGLVLETLLKRETLGSTGIGKGVAIPHCRTLAANEIHIVVGMSEHGIEYSAVDKKNVHIFFLIIAPPHEKANLYLPLLGKIVEMVRDLKIRRQFMKVKDFESFIHIIQEG